MATPTSILRRPFTTDDLSQAHLVEPPVATPSSTIENRRTLARSATHNIAALTFSHHASPVPAQSLTPTPVRRIEVQSYDLSQTMQNLTLKISDDISSLHTISSAHSLTIDTDTLEKIKQTVAIAKRHLTDIEDTRHEMIESAEEQGISADITYPDRTILEVSRNFTEIIEANLNVISKNLRALSLSQEHPSMHFRPGFARIAHTRATNSINSDCIFQKGGNGAASLIVHDNGTRYVIKSPLKNAMGIVSQETNDVLAAEIIVNYSLPIHPGLMEFYGVNEEGHSLLGFISGEELFDAILNRSLRSAQKYEIAKELAKTLTYFHSQGRIHCDLKPENIMLTDDKKPKLIDFDTCRFKFESGEDTSEIGTVLYLAPEMFNPEAPKDNKIDVWGFGATLYTMLSESHFWSDVIDVCESYYPDKDGERMTAKRLLEYSDGNIDMEISEVFDNLELHLDRTTSLTTRQKFKLLLVLRSCLKIRSTERLPMEEILRIF